MGDTIRFSQNFDPHIYTISPTGELIKRFELVYTYHPLPPDFEEKILKKNLALFKSPESNFDAIRDLFTNYTGYRSPIWETKDYLMIVSFDTKQNPFVTLFHKKKKQVMAQGRYFETTNRYKMALPSHFYTTDVEENRFISLMEGYQLIQHIDGESPYFEEINRELESFFIVEVDFIEN